MNNIWVSDPKTGESSVSLTLFILSGLVLIIAMGLEISGATNTTSIAFEFFGTSAGLYFGRKYTTAKGQSLTKE